jgi:hypothetical protein
MYANLSGLFGLLLVLSGCAPSQQIIHGYDETTKAKVCHTNGILIRNEFGLTSSRQTYFVLTMQPDGMVKGTFTSQSNVGLTSYDSFAPDAKVTFRLKDKNQTMKNLIFQGDTAPTKYGSQYQYVHGVGMYSMTNKSSFLSFLMTKDQLREILASDQIEFIIDSGSNPLEGKVNENEKRLFESFLNQCS